MKEAEKNVATKIQVTRLSDKKQQQQPKKKKKLKSFKDLIQNSKSNEVMAWRSNRLSGKALNFLLDHITV